MGHLDQFRDAIDRADQIYESGNLAEALRFLNDIHIEEEYKDDDLYARFLCVLGSAQAELGQIEPATKSFEEALEYHRIRNQLSGMGLIHFNR